MQYAVIKIGAHQYKVSEGQEVLIDKNEKPEVEVLMYVDKDKVLVGKPTVPGVAVKLKVMDNERGEKIDVFKYKSKSRSRKHTGFRHDFTRVKIDSIAYKK